jgi:transposase
MDEGRKRTLLIAACILAARRLAQLDGRPSPALESCIADAITMAEKIMRKIDSRWPSEGRA